MIGRSAILIYSYRWLSTTEFALIAATLSFVEISRAFSDFGAENIIYTRLSSSIKPLSHIVKNLIKLRLVISFFISSAIAAFSYFFISPETWPLFFLPVISSIQNSSVALMQKNRDFKKILSLMISVLCMGTISVISVIWFEFKGLVLITFMILPELFSAIIGGIITRRNWSQILSNVNKSGRLLNRLLPYVIPSMAVSILVVLYSRLDVIMVLPLLGINAQADYSLGLRLVEPVFLLLSLGSLTLLAELGSYNTQNARLLMSTLVNILNVKTYVLLCIAGFFVAFCLRAFAVEYLEFNVVASWVTFLLVLAIPIKLCNTFLTTLLQRGGLYHVVMKAAICVFLLTMTFGLILGSYFGVPGIVFATLIAELFNFHYQKRMVHYMFKGN